MWRGLLLALATLVYAIPASADAVAVGTVRVWGPWLVDGRAVENDTTAAYEGARIVIGSGLTPERRRAAKVEVDYSVKGQGPDVCSGTEECATQGLVIHAKGRPDSAIARLWRLLTARPEPDTAAARGIGNAIRDGVVQRDGKRLLIGPLLTDVEPGRYRIRFRPLESTSDRIIADVSIVVSQDTQLAGIRIAANDVRDGPYRVQLVEASNADPVGDEAWIAVAAPPTYKAQLQIYQKAVAVTRSWPQTPENEARATLVLRNLLRSLADANRNQ